MENYDYDLPVKTAEDYHLGLHIKESIAEYFLSQQSFESEQEINFDFKIYIQI